MIQVNKINEMISTGDCFNLDTWLNEINTLDLKCCPMDGSWNNRIPLNVATFAAK